DEGADVGFEQVGAHARHVSDVVADVVGDHRRVAGVVLGDAGLHLADEVRPDVGRLRVDATADTGEQGDGRTAETDGGDDLRRPRGPEVGVHLDEDQVADRHAEETETGHGEAHHRPAAEGHGEGTGDASEAGGFGGAGVGGGGDAHPHETGGSRQDGAENVGEGAQPAV